MRSQKTKREMNRRDEKFRRRNVRGGEVICSYSEDKRRDRRPWSLVLVLRVRWWNVPDRFVDNWSHRYRSRRYHHPGIASLSPRSDDINKTIFPFSTKAAVRRSLAFRDGSQLPVSTHFFFNHFVSLFRLLASIFSVFGFLDGYRYSKFSARVRATIMLPTPSSFVRFRGNARSPERDGGGVEST